MIYSNSFKNISKFVTKDSYNVLSSLKTLFQSSLAQCVFEIFLFENDFFTAIGTEHMPCESM